MYGGDSEGPHLDFKTAGCAPGVDDSGGSCYSDDVINEMKQTWNKRHPSSQIETSNPRSIWSELKYNLSSSCSNERCWAVKLLTARRRKELIPRLFVPSASKSWCKKPNTWLDSADISRVMRQYERAFDSFKFFGPAPIDFASKDKDGDDVWPELATIDVSHLLKKGQVCTGFIFNTDPHTKDGEHWISMFMDLRKSEPIIAYSDSNGKPAPKKVQDLVKELQAQYRVSRPNGPNISLIQNKIRHQKGTTECGIYCLHMIISLLENKYTAKDYLALDKPDSMMTDLREQFFVKDCAAP